MPTLTPTSSAAETVLNSGLRVHIEPVKDSEKVSVKVWKPKSQRPYAYYIFRNWENAEVYILEQNKRLNEHKEQVKQRREERKATPEKLASVKVGDIFYSSWGYDQTNVDFYQVVAINKSMATLREIGAVSSSVEGMSDMSCYVKADKDNFLVDREPLKRRIQFLSDNKPYFKICQVSDAWQDDGSKHYCSWYH